MPRRRKEPVLDPQLASDPEPVDERAHAFSPKEGPVASRVDDVRGIVTEGWPCVTCGCLADVHGAVS